MTGPSSQELESPAAARRSSRGLSVHLRGHVLLFDRKPPPAFDALAGVYLLCTVVFLEVMRLTLVSEIAPLVYLRFFIPLQLAVALLSVLFMPGVSLSQIGFRPWREWSRIEKSYFLQLLVIANVVFPLVFAARLRVVFFQPSVMATVWNVFVPYLFFGFYQEVVYRGMLQSELVRRWGAFLGVLVSNVLYTFGPLHWYYFLSQPSVAIPMFASIFAIGLFFGLLFRRSGNLWIVAIIHGIGNAYIVGSLGSIR